MALQPADEKANVPVPTATDATHHVSDVKLAATVTTTSTLAVSTNTEYHRMSDVSTPASNRELNPFDTDLEAMISSRTTREDDSCGMKSGDKANLNVSPEGQVWPGKDHWKKKAKANKVNQRSCQCLAKMSKRNRILVKVGIILLVVAIGVGVGFGISKPLGAGIWKGGGE